MEQPAAQQPVLPDESVASSPETLAGEGNCHTTGRGGEGGGGRLVSGSQSTVPGAVEDRMEGFHAELKEAWCAASNYRKEAQSSSQVRFGPLLPLLIELKARSVRGNQADLELSII